jgi:cobalamin synthase
VEGPPEGDTQSSSLSIPGPADLLGALALLTRFPLPRPDVREPTFGRAAMLFPVAGALIGCLVLALDAAIGSFLPQAPMLLRSAAVVVFWESIVRRSADDRDSSSKALALAALGLAAFKTIALCYLPAPRTIALLFAPLLGAWSMVVLAVGARDAGIRGRKFAPAVLFNEFALASLFTFGIVFATAEAVGVLVVVVAAASTLALRLLSHARIGGISWVAVVLAAALVETAVLSILAVLATALAAAPQN